MALWNGWLMSHLCRNGLVIHEASCVDNFGYGVDQCFQDWNGRGKSDKDH